MAVEFALVAARRYRLEEAAERSAAALAALRSSRDLSLLLAGSQLGITLCTLGLGAVAKPAVHDLLPARVHRLGPTTVTADVVAFVAALIAVTFVHLVIGEMAPKSWAIAHPERSAILLAPADARLHGGHPAAAAALNAWRTPACAGSASCRWTRSPRATTRTACASSSSIRPRPGRWTASGATAGHGAGATPRRWAPLVRPHTAVSTVGVDAGAEEIRVITRRTGHLRLVVRDGEQLVGMVHVRDALTAPADTRARSLMRPVLTLSADEPAYAALRTMRERRSHLALVRDDGGLVGLLTMRDLLDRLLPEPAGRR